MITATRITSHRVGLVFELPLNAKEISDAVAQANRLFGDEWDDCYTVTSDGGSITFWGREMNE